MKNLLRNEWFVAILGGLTSLAVFSAIGVVSLVWPRIVMDVIIVILVLIVAVVIFGFGAWLATEWWCK